MTPIIGLYISYMGLACIMISIVCTYNEVKKNHEFRVDFYKDYSLKNLKTLQIIEGKIIYKALFLAGIVIALIGYIVALFLFDISILLMFDFKRAFLLIIPIIVGLIICMFWIDKCFVKIYISPDKLIVKNLITKKTIYFSELDYLEFVQQDKGFWTISSYIFKKKGATILKLRTRAFKNLQIIEDVFSG